MNRTTDHEVGLGLYMVLLFSSRPGPRAINTAPVEDRESPYDSYLD